MNFKTWFYENTLPENIWYKGSTHSNPFDPNTIKKFVNNEWIYGWYFSKDLLYAATYSNNHSIYVAQINTNRLKEVDFNYGMTITQDKYDELMNEKVDGITFDGMKGPELAIINPHVVMPAEGNYQLHKVVYNKQIRQWEMIPPCKVCGVDLVSKV